MAPEKQAWLSAGPGRLIVLSGPSGVGKDTVLRRLFQRVPTLRYSISFTTRPPRPDEVDGVSYSFVDEAQFLAMVAGDEFLEWARYAGHYYGTSIHRVQAALSRGEDIVLKIEVQGAARVRRRVTGNAMFIFLEPPSLSELQRRLLDRETEDAATLDARFGIAREELAEAHHYDHRVVNDEVDGAVDQIVGLIQPRSGGRVDG